MKTIGPNDTAIDSAPISNFATTWAKEWTPLSNPNDTTPRVSSNSTGRLHWGLPSGAKAGIGVGGAVAGLAVAAAVMLFLHSKRRGFAPQQERMQIEPQSAPVHEKSGEPYYVETGEGMPHEAETDGEVHELAIRKSS